MLQELKVLNGDLSLKFDPLNTRYTVTMNTNDTFLKLEYITNPEDKISIIGNNIINDVNEVVITVNNENTSMSYYLEVYKKETEEVNNILNNYVSVDATIKKEVPKLAVPIISSICFIIILLSFTILFKKKKM